MVGRVKQRGGVGQGEGLLGERQGGADWKAVEGGLPNLLNFSFSRILFTLTFTRNLYVFMMSSITSPNSSIIFLLLFLLPLLILHFTPSRR